MMSDEMWEGPAAGSKAAKAWTDMQRMADLGVRALALLREVEWTDCGEGTSYCPACEGQEPYELWSDLAGTARSHEGGHAPDCKLKALLEESNGE